MTKRERTIAIITGAVVALWLVFQYALTPLMDSREQLELRIEMLNREVVKANEALKKNREASKRWEAFRAAGLAADASETERNLLSAMGQWSSESGLPLQTLRPDRAVTNKGLHELTFQAGAEGPMRSVAAFLYRIESAKVPVRVRELQIASRTDATDDLSLQMRVSTLWEDAPAPGSRSAAVRKAVQR